MAIARDVAAYIISTGRWDRWSVQKLSYYAQAWHLTWEGRALFPERIEAWPDGPVIRNVWQAQQYEAAHPSDMPGGDPSALTETEKASIDAVLEFYRGCSGRQLVDRTHDEQPWQAARGDLPPSARSTSEITPRSMRAFYTRVALTGGDVPTRQMTSASTCRADVSTIISEERARWADTLAELAAR